MTWFKLRTPFGAESDHSINWVPTIFLRYFVFFLPKTKTEAISEAASRFEEKKKFFGAKIIFWRKFHFTTTEEFFTIQKCWNLASKESEKIEIVLKKEKEKAALTPEKIFFYF